MVNGQRRSLIKKTFKLTALDFVVLLLLLGTAVYILYRIKAGLHYKWNWSAIPQYLFRYDEESARWTPNVLMLGLFTTLRLSVWSTLLAIVLGGAVGLLRTSPSLFKRLTGRTYVELIRNLPPLVLIFIFYFFVSDQVMQALHVEEFIRSRSESTQAVLTLLFAPPSLFTQFMAAFITLGIFEGAYIAEIVRAGIQSIEKGQWEASYALGLSRRQQMQYIILPQATRRILPPLAGQFISTIKDSAIVAVISIPELTFQGMELMASTYLTFEIWITITLLYLILTLSLSLGVSRLELLMKKREG
jgi:polar amino acid transport system permease protein